MEARPRSAINPLSAFPGSKFNDPLFGLSLNQTIWAMNSWRLHSINFDPINDQENEIFTLSTCAFDISFGFLVRWWSMKIYEVLGSRVTTDIGK